MNPLKRLFLFCSALGLLLFAGPLAVSAHNVDLGDFSFSGNGFDSNQQVLHYDADPWKGFFTLTATNTGTQNWTDFHFGIFSVGSDVSHVYFQGGDPTSSNGPVQWTATPPSGSSGATLDLIFTNLVIPNQSVTLTVYTDNTQDHVNFGMLFYPTITPVPIPGAVWLLGSGLVGLVGLRRTKSRKCR
jgi:hypothetical protein